MTGWGTGYCGGNRTGAGKFSGRGWQCGTGWGSPRSGGGRGWRNMFYATGQPGWRRAGWDVAPTSEQEAQSLKDKAAALENELKQVNQRLAEVEDVKS